MDILDIMVAKALSGGGGTGGGVVCVTFATADGVTFTADKTYAELAAAVHEKKWVYGWLIDEDDSGTYTNTLQWMSLNETSDDASSIVFLFVDPGATSTFYIINSDDTVIVEPVE